MSPSLLFLSFLLCLSTATATVVLTTAAITIPTVTVGTSAATTLAALGLIKLKGAALLALSRNRRQAEPQEEENNILSFQQEVLWTSVAKVS